MMVVGGMGSITGSIVSVIGFTIVLEWLRNYATENNLKIKENLRRRL